MSKINDMEIRIVRDEKFCDAGSRTSISNFISVLRESCRDREKLIKAFEILKGHIHLSCECDAKTRKNPVAGTPCDECFILGKAERELEGFNN